MLAKMIDLKNNLSLFIADYLFVTPWSRGFCKPNHVKFICK